MSVLMGSAYYNIIRALKKTIRKKIKEFYYI